MNLEWVKTGVWGHGPRRSKLHVKWARGFANILATVLVQSILCPMNYLSREDENGRYVWFLWQHKIPLNWIPNSVQWNFNEIESSKFTKNTFPEIVQHLFVGFRLSINYSQHVCKLYICLATNISRCLSLNRHVFRNITKHNCP